MMFLIFCLFIAHKKLIILYAELVHLNAFSVTSITIFPLAAMYIDRELAIEPLPHKGDFVHYDFLKLQYISHTLRHVSHLRVVVLLCNSNITYVTLQIVKSLWYKY